MAEMNHIKMGLFALVAMLFTSCMKTDDTSLLEQGFLNPPDSARPGVYWYFMDGNLSKESMTKDLESMKEVGIGNVVYLEVNVGVPRGTVDFLSLQWQDMFKHAVEECERLGIDITLGVGPGWTGSGGPWVEGAASMQHLVSSSLTVSGGKKQRINLPVPDPKTPFFGAGGFPPDMRQKWEDYYEDVAVLAIPAGRTTMGNEITPGRHFIPVTRIEEEALYYRKPYSSVDDVIPFIPTTKNYGEQPGDKPVFKNEIIDLTAFLQPDGSLEWDVPSGEWTIMRFGSRNNGAVTRPAALPGVGMEADKFNPAAMEAHLDQFIGKLFRHIGFTGAKPSGGLQMLHMDSWEMGAQNWTQQFREEFTGRRGYDPLPFYPVYAGEIIESREISERFLWDLRQTAQELVLENHAGYIRQYAQKYGMGFSVEPYDMNPTSDLELAITADMPMCEFWSLGGFNTSFSAMEGTSAAHLIGQPVVPAEAFTAAHDGWKQHPGSMKNQNDWAFASGINRLVYHTFQHQSLPDNLRPGMTMGPYGVHWDRNQTWWPMSGAYHTYVSRCQFMLQQGRTVADVLYLTPEGAPHVFRAPESALDGDEPMLPDRKGYNFDGCPPGMLYQASVKDGQIVFPGDASYRILVLPVYETMTPALLEKIADLLKSGATIVGLPPVKSPGLSDYPACDQKVQALANDIWGTNTIPEALTTKTLGKGKLIFGKELAKDVNNLYPHYHTTAAILSEIVPEDFMATGPIRYTHRTTGQEEIYFVANRSDRSVSVDCRFRVGGMKPELWNPIAGKIRSLPQYIEKNGQIIIPLEFDTYEGYFIVFRKHTAKPESKINFSQKKQLAVLDAPWEVYFDPAWGGPAKVTFPRLTDWSEHPDEGIKYYSGTAVYHQQFDKPATRAEKLFLDLGQVKNMARIKLNGVDMGVVWTAPWQVEITGAIQDKNNHLEIEVVNLWPNRLIGDEHLPDDGIRQGRWPEWLTNHTPRTSGRYTFTTYRHYTKDSPLLESGLLGPVRILEATDF